VADDEELPCPECEGWMVLRDKRWVCPSCGAVSEEDVPEDDPEEFARRLLDPEPEAGEAKAGEGAPPTA
jgi:transcription initiation factor TFIIIB Brf1 subunit/transcription initiation factor TFIIB